MPKNYPTTLGHQALTLVGTAFLVFEAIFLTFYVCDFWFGTTLAGMGIFAVAAAALVSHLLLTFLESPYAIARLAFIWKGRPPVIYRRWLTVLDDGFCFGLRGVLFSAADEMKLSLFGNLIILSRAVCGNLSAQPDRVVKIPFAAAGEAQAKDFIACVQQRHPDVVLNKRLTAAGPLRKLKGVAFVQLLGPIFMLVVLLDVANVSFDYLEVMKDYYLANRQAQARNIDQARLLFNKAQALERQAFPLSYVRKKFFGDGMIAAFLFQERSQAKWYMGNSPGALSDARKAVACEPKSARYNLYLARLLSAMGNERQARAAINAAISGHADLLVPRLYLLSSFLAKGDKRLAKQYSSHITDDFDERIFVDEPAWPPGGDAFLNEMFYSDDLKYLLPRFANGLNDRRTPCGR